jgi:hypothetical protein|tara:strand:- start:15992 stop:16402 length:411 start_codon:yes stop_codon:yes gene_type:complete
MAANTKKRVAVKHIRDGIKSNYKKDCKCAICSTEEKLELHHYTTVSTLFKNYVEEHNIPVDTDEEVRAMRDDFYKMYWYELVDYTVTLCEEHHRKLHSIYGREPPLHTAKKQERWVEKQRDKAEGKTTKGRFASLI